jgi:gamma-glutamylcyclotransferase (GGCT)/AIG2-like uncharacterized protein YtfP
MSTEQKEDNVVYYFGYGSNMSSNMLIAKGITVLSSRPCLLRGYRLAFNLYTGNITEPSYANLVESKMDIVHGVLYTYTKQDIKKMDSLETAYKRCQVTGELYDGTTLTMSTYIMTEEEKPEHITLQDYPPSVRYLNVLIAGAIEHKLNPTYISFLKNHPFTPLPVLTFTAEQETQISAKVFSKSDLALWETENPGRFLFVVKGIVLDMTSAKYPPAYKQAYHDTTIRLGHSTFMVAQRHGTGEPTSIVGMSDDQKAYVDAILMSVLPDFPILGSTHDREDWDWAKEEKRSCRMCDTCLCM